MKDRATVVALAGTPNTGKSTLFNALTGLRTRVGNYPGVTVERQSGFATHNGQKIEFVDTPGTYSLVARTGEEQVAVEALIGLRSQEHPDIVLICADATNLVRSLYLALQVREFGTRCVVALTMLDELAESSRIDITALSGALGCLVVGVNARRRRGLGELLDAIVATSTTVVPPAKWAWQPSVELAGCIDVVQTALPSTWPNNPATALWALMSLDSDDELHGIPDSLRASVARYHERGEEIDDEVVCSRYQWLDNHVAPLARVQAGARRTDKLDRVLLHPVAGFAVFLSVMFLLFQSLFAWTAPAIDWIERLFAWFGSLLESSLGPGLFTEFLVNGLVAGVGAVLVFLPQILLLFFFIGLLEDLGYMARVAALMDRIMKAMNLHGRAFVPMLSGFACAVPAILATRTMERRRDRLLTMAVVPLMTCSARLPIYTLIIAALFPASSWLGVFPVQGLLMVAMYIFSVVTALLAAWVMAKTMPPLKAKRLPFVIELPAYRIPRLGDVSRMMWRHTSHFVREAGGVILVCTIVLWALLSFPRAPHSEGGAVDGGADLVASESTASAQLNNSYGGRLGKLIEPTIAPLGFDWKIGVGIIGAFAAREVFISTMGIVYRVGAEVDENDETLRAQLRKERHPDGRAVYTPLVGLALMIFFALACQCMSTLAAIKRETGGYRWPAFVFAYMTALAWVCAFVVYQGGKLLGFS